MESIRTLIVGDVHGCFDELQELLKKAKFNQATDRLIFVGDLINKGPKSLEVLKWVKSSGAEVVLGNHELGFIHYIDNPTAKKASFEKLKIQMGPELPSWVNWFKSLPLFIEEEFIVVHGGVVPGMELSNTPGHLATRIRTWDGEGSDLNNKENPAWYDLYSGDKLVVYGHWAADGLKVQDKTIGLDSGCCWGGKLSLLHLESLKIFQVDALEAYSAVKS